MTVSLHAAGRSRCARHPRARGFTLVEIMVSILIGLFLTGGLLTLVQTMKQTYGVQNGLSQLQDSERMAMTLLADVIQQAGYFPNPTANTAAGYLPVVAPFTVDGQQISFAVAGQTLYGTGGYNDLPPDQTLTVRYMTSGTDNVINCTGNPSAVQTTFINTFFLQADPVAGNYDLMCSLNGGAPVQLVSGITNMQIYYGVQTNPAVSNNSVDTYLDGATVTAKNLWGNVLSVKARVTFANPLYGNLGGQGQTTNTPQTIVYERVIDVMNRTGVSP